MGYKQLVVGPSSVLAMRMRMDEEEDSVSCNCTGDYVQGLIVFYGS